MDIRRLFGFLSEQSLVRGGRFGLGAGLRQSTAGRKDLVDRLQIATAIHGIRLQVTAFGPFVPAIDIHDSSSIGI